MTVKPVAFYLPQFHPVKENSEWWGEGFTEWTNVAKARPLFQGHYQPHIPKHLGFYDLRLLDVMKSQVNLAKTFGIHGFCFYHYWFNGRRILELPVNNFLASDIDFPFCLCWANENWTRNWNGGDQAVLLKQDYSAESARQFIVDLIPYLKDPRYIRIDKKPMVLVYRALAVPNIKAVTALWRDVVRQHGFSDLHLVSVRSAWTPMSDPSDYGFDALVEFPPAKCTSHDIELTKTLKVKNAFNHGFYDYEKAIENSSNLSVPSFLMYRGIMPSWDNTARNQNNAGIFINSSPSAYYRWLTHLVAYTHKNLPQDRRFIFINAWNEWAEGAHLEPDLKHDLAYLTATQKALIDGSPTS